MSTRIFRLIERHARIDDALRLEQRRAGGDWQRITELKRLKLRIKDMIHRFVTRQRPVRNGG